MKKGKLYLIVIIILFVSILLIYEVANVGNGDIYGPLFVSFISLLIPILVYRGVPVIKWIGIVGFSFMAIAFILAGIENSEYLFLVMMLGYAYVVWQLLMIKAPIIKENDIAENIIDHHMIKKDVEAEQTFDHREYPLLIKRLQAIFIDSMLLLTVMIIVMLLSEETANAVEIRVSVLLALMLLYEPLLTVYASTLGQKFIGIRVRDFNDPTKRINLLQSYLRIITKDMLGWLSFLTIHANQDRRAIHDFVASSVMVYSVDKKS